MKRLALRIAMAALGLAVVALAVIASSTRIQDRILTALAAARLTSDAGARFPPDALHVFVCGSSSPLPSRGRAQACIGAVADGALYLFDVGDGAWRNIELWRLPQQRLEAVFLTHFHSDHFADLGQANVQSWIWGRREPISVYGPAGVQSIVQGFNAAFSPDYALRHRQAGEALLPRSASRLRSAPFRTDGSEIETVYRAGDLTVSAFAVDHGPVKPAVGYRLDYRGRSVVISGDTMPSAALAGAAGNVDVLFHEAVSERLAGILVAAVRRSGDERLQAFAPRFGEAHTTVAEAGEIAASAKVGKLVLYHLLPPPDNPLMAAMFADELPGDVVLARDALMFSLPADSKLIRERTLK